MMKVLLAPKRSDLEIVTLFNLLVVKFADAFKSFRAF